VDAAQPVMQVETMEDMVSDSISQQRFTMLLLAAFAGLALLLAAAGIYSVLSYSVRRRVREIGIRMALGAQISDVLRLVIVEGMKPALLGLAIGLAGALALGRVLSKLIYGVSPADPATFAAVSALLAAVALAASIIPAARATRVEPVKTLREE
jgi:putative ABC transport system permease protein